MTDSPTFEHEATDLPEVLRVVVGHGANAAGAQGEEDALLTIQLKGGQARQP